jgi:hypothetical protein
MEAAVAMRSQYEEVGFGRSPDEGYGRVLTTTLLRTWTPGAVFSAL